MLRLRPRSRTSSNLRLMFFHSLPILFSYALRTEANNGSDAGCVEENARSRTYKSTALSSTSVDIYAKPKSIRTWVGVRCAKINHAMRLTSPAFSLGIDEGWRSIMFEVVRSPWMTSARCILAISVPTICITSSVYKSRM